MGRVALMRTLGYFHVYLFLTTAIVASSELLESEPSSDVVRRSGSIREAEVMRALRSTHNQIPILDQGILRNLKRSSPGHDQASIRDNGILKSSRSNVHDLELMRSLMSVKMDVGSDAHSDGLMRSLRSIR